MSRISDDAPENWNFFRWKFWVRCESLDGVACQEGIWNFNQDFNVRKTHNFYVLAQEEILHSLPRRRPPRVDIDYRYVALNSVLRGFSNNRWTYVAIEDNFMGKIRVERVPACCKNNSRFTCDVKDRMTTATESTGRFVAINNNIGAKSQLHFLSTCRSSTSDELSRSSFVLPCERQTNVRTSALVDGFRSNTTYLVIVWNALLYYQFNSQSTVVFIALMRVAKPCLLVSSIYNLTFITDDEEHNRTTVPFNTVQFKSVQLRPFSSSQFSSV